MGSRRRRRIRRDLQRAYLGAAECDSQREGRNREPANGNGCRRAKGIGNTAGYQGAQWPHVVRHAIDAHYAAAQLEKLRADTEASERQMQSFLGYVTRYLGSRRIKNGRTVTYTRDYWRTARNTGSEDDPRT